MSVQSRHFRQTLQFGVLLLCLNIPLHPEGFESLLRSSPFGQPAVDTAGGSAVQPLEFRGVMIEGGKQYFSIHETKTRKSMWIGVNESGQPYQLRDYDEARGILKVEYQGSLLALSLKNAVIVVSSPENAKPATPDINSAAPSPSPNPRIRQLAEEAARRRAAARMQKN